MKRAVLILAILYLLFLVLGAAVMHSDWNSHWLATLFLFSPRWVVALPLLGLIPWTLWVRWRLSWVFLVHTVVILVPIFGYEFGGTAHQPSSADQVLRVLTCNVGGGKLDQQTLVALVREHHVDVVMLQECAPSVSRRLFEELEWSHQQAYLIAIGSPLPLGDPVVLAKQPKTIRAASAVSCDLQWPVRNGEPEHRESGDRVKLVVLHLPTFRPVFEKLQRFEIAHGARTLTKVAKTYSSVVKKVHDEIKDVPNPVILGGDFNVPVESVHYRDFWHDFHNAHSVAGSGFGYTKFTRHHGVRIDHILADHHWTVTNSWVGPNLGGDHRPVIAELVKRSQAD